MKRLQIFFCFECRTTSIASRRTYNSALKMLAVSRNRTRLVLSQKTTAAATLLPSLEPSVNMRQYLTVVFELITEFIKTMSKDFRKSVAFVRAM